MADIPETGYFNVHKYADQAADGATATGTSYVSPADVMADASAGQALVVSFRHEPSGQSVFFKAFITTLNESYSSDWAEEAVFGRTDPIQLFKQTSRRITLGLKVPAETIGEAYDNLGRISSLTHFLYPNYTKVGQYGHADTIAQGPVLRMKVMNLIQKTPAAPASTDGETPAANASFKSYKSSANASEGLMGVITSLSINHNLENADIGIFTHQSNTIFSSMIEVNIDFVVLHESTLGWNGSEFSQPTFPYGVKVMSVADAAAAQGRLDSSRTTTTEDPNAAQNEQQRQAALRRYATLGGKARMKKDLVFLAKMSEKMVAGEELTARQQANVDYLSDTLTGAGIDDHLEGAWWEDDKSDLRDAAGAAYEDFIP